jgi:hypothetical protein
MTAVTEVLKRHKRVAKDHEIADRLVGTAQQHDNHCTCRPFSRDSTTAWQPLLKPANSQHKTSLMPTAQPNHVSSSCSMITATVLSLHSQQCRAGGYDQGTRQTEYYVSTLDPTSISFFGPITLGARSSFVLPHRSSLVRSMVGAPSFKINVFPGQQQVKSLYFLG